MKKWFENLKAGFKELVDRWKAESPAFWIKVKNIAITLCASAIAVRTLNASMDLQLGTLILDVCRYTIAAGAAIGLSAQFTKQ